MDRLINEISMLDTGDFTMSAYVKPPTEYDVEGIQATGFIDVCHRKGPHVYRAIHPVNLAYPDSCYGSIVRTILNIAKHGVGTPMN